MSFEQVRALPDGTTEYDYSYASNPHAPASTQFSNPKSSINRPARNSEEHNNRSDLSATKQDDGDDDIGKATWNDFIGNTTFHGCRFVFVDSKSKFRRLLWLLCILSSVTLFTYQVASRTIAYFDYQSNVNVEMVYENEVIFPTVTICNQNNYRISEVVPRKMDTILQTMYNPSADDSKINNSFPGENLHNFTRNSAHQLLDLVRRCKWRGEECDLVNRFQIRQTDFGQCYTFNIEEGGISEKGSAFGLSLILNIEQYEYSWGPHSEAGIKVLLHDPREHPLVSDLGFAVAPGTQTLVAVRREEVHSLPPPYGKCDPQAIPRSDCVLSCRTAKAVQTCGCRDVYMPPQRNESSCDLNVAFTCLFSMTGQTNSTCECKAPCRRVTYTPELSYAHLSRSNIASVLPDAEAGMMGLETKYIHAREVSNHYNPRYIKLNKNKFQRIDETSKAYLKAIEDATAIFKGNEAVFQITGINLSFSDIVTELASDLYVRVQRYELLWYYFRAKYYNPGGSESPWALVSDVLFQLENNVLIEYDIHKFCADEEQAGDPTSFNCRYLGVQLHLLYPIMSVSSKVITKFADLEDGYDDDISAIYSNTSIYQTILSNPLYHQCKDILRIQSEFLTPKTRIFKDAVLDYNTAVTATEKFRIMTQFYEYYNDTLDFGLFNETLYSPCEFYLKMDLNQDLPDIAKKYEATTKAAEKSMAKLVEGTAEYGLDLYDHLDENLDELYLAYSNYLTHPSSTKVNLHKHVTTGSYRDKMETVTGVQSLLESSLGDTLNVYKEMISYLRGIITLQYNSSFPWRTTDIWATNLVKIAQTQMQNDSSTQHYLSLIDIDNYAVLMGLVDEVYGRYEVAAEDTYSNLKQTYRDLQDTTDKARSYLEAFIDANELNEDFVLENFMKLEIFYKEIGYTLVSQIPAFEFISLLSEVGGFLGLLMGASMLTVCELLDYLTLSTLRKCRMTGKVQPIV